MKKLKIVVVDDNSIFRQGIIFFLKELINYEVIAEFSNGVDLLNSDAMYLADIVLMDIEMPQINGIVATQKAMWHYSGIKVIAVTNHKEKTYLNELIPAGFRGCVLKNNIYNDLEQALLLVFNGKLFFKDNTRINPDSFLGIYANQ